MNHYPAAGDIPSAHPSISEAKVSKIITTHIHGAVQNFSAGGDNVNQSANLTVQTGDKGALLRVLREAGVESAEVQALDEAMTADQADASGTGTVGMGQRVKAWLGNLQMKAAQHLGGVPAEVVGGLITQAILAYYGIAA